MSLSSLSETAVSNCGRRSSSLGLFDALSQKEVAWSLETEIIAQIIFPISFMEKIAGWTEAHQGSPVKSWQKKAVAVLSLTVLCITSLQNKNSKKMLLLNYDWQSYLFCLITDNISHILGLEEKLELNVFQRNRTMDLIPQISDCWLSFPFCSRQF